MYAPMKMGFPTGMAGGGITQFLQPLQEYLSQQVVQQQVQPFITEVSDEAQERFNLGGTGSNDILSNNIFDNDIFSGGIGTLPPPMSAGPDAALMNNNLLPAIKDAQALYGGMIDMEGNPSGIGTISGFPSPNEPMPGIAPDPRPLMNGFPVAQPELGGNVGGDFMGSAQNYFGNNIDPRGPVTPMTPEDIFRQAQMRNMQQDVKSPEVQAYLDNIIKTGGRPTIMAPKANYSNLADEFGNLFQLPSVGPMYGPEGTYSLTGGPRPVSQDPYGNLFNLSRAVNQ